MQSDSSKIISGFFTVLIFIFAIIFFFFVTEVYFRVFSPQERYDDCHTDNWQSHIIQNITIGFEYKPNLKLCNYAPQTHEKIRFSTNNAGFRILKDVDKSKANNTTRIILLGDSFVEGTDVADTETISYHLDTLLTNNYEILNLGRKSTGTASQFAFLNEIGLLYKPDVAVLFFYPNDFADNIISFPQYKLNKNGTLNPMPIFKQSFFDKPVKRNSVLAFLTRHSHSASFLYNTLQKLYEQKLQPKPTYFMETDDSGSHFTISGGFDFAVHSLSENYHKSMKYSLLVTLRLFEEFQKLADKNKFKLVIINIPSRYQFDIEETKKTFSPELLQFYHDVGGKLIPDKQNKIFGSFFRSTNITYIDLFYNKNFSTNYQNLYFRNGHTNREGNKFIASQVYSILKNQTDYKIQKKQSKFGEIYLNV